MTAVLALLASAVLAPVASAQDSSRFRLFLSQIGGYDDGDLRALADGRIDVRTLAGTGDDEVAVLAVLRTGMTADGFSAVARALADAIADESVVSVGRFGAPPSAADMAGLRLPDEIARELADCRPADCKVKVTDDILRRVHALDASAPNFRQSVDSIFRGKLLGYVEDYAARGNEALLVLDDKAEPQSVREALTGLFAESGYLNERFPSLHRYLQRYPDTDGGVFEDILFWEVQDLGLRPIVKLEHRTLFTPNDSEVRRLAATKWLYSTHYMLAALELSALVEPASAARLPGHYLVYLARFRFDGRVMGLKRREVRGKLEGVVKKRLEALAAASR